RITETSKSPGTGTPGEATSVVSLGFGGASGGAAALGPVVVQSVSSETTGGGRVTQIKTMYVSEIPPEYRHLVPSNTY
ncbi:MAG: hypothetical protein N2255_03145, partial [Kiritimatiellae bacterium]|nr:hypothetical protein [Kiritimatiellia bacterium]